MTLWQRRARLAFAIVALSVTAVVGYTLRPRPVPQAPPDLPKLEPTAKIQTIGGDVLQLKGARTDLRLEFQKQVTYENGQTTLYGVKARVDNRGGRNYVISGNEARVGKDQSSFEMKGNVKLETDDGLTAFSEMATYTEAEKIVRAPGPVKFARGRMTGSGVGFTYDDQRNTLWLLDKASVNFAPDEQNGPMSVTAGAFGFARGDRYMRFERVMHMEREGQIIDADEALVHLFQDRDEPDLIELRGKSRVTGGANVGALQSMAADDINLDYREDGRTLQQAILAGQAAIQLSAKGGSGGQRLSGRFLDIALAEDGSVKHLASRENVTVTLPAAKDTPARTIRSTSLIAAGDSAGLSTMKFQEGVEYREAATKTQGARVAKAQTLDAELDPEAGTLRQATFAGGFNFVDGALTATSARAVYQIGPGTLALSGEEHDVVPSIKDERLRIDADALDITLQPRKMVAAGKVRTVLQPDAKPAPDTPAVKRPGLLAEKESVNILADKLTYDESSRRGDYSGQARLVQGETQIHADTITLDESKGDLIANGKVVTTLQIVSKDKDAAAGPKPAGPTIARAGSFNYTDETRRATYKTGAQFNGEHGNLTAETIALQLAPAENSLAGLDASGAVTAIVEKRTVKGARLTYAPEEEKYVVTGAPVTMIDAECQELSGKTLTFFKSSDRVQVDGNNEVRTQTKGGGKCVQTTPK